MEVMRVTKKDLLSAPSEKVFFGPVTEKEKETVLQLLHRYRDCFAESVDELGCAKSLEVQIRLNEDRPIDLTECLRLKHTQMKKYTRIMLTGRSSLSNN